LVLLLAPEARSKFSLERRTRRGFSAARVARACLLVVYADEAFESAVAVENENGSV